MQAENCRRGLLANDTQIIQGTIGEVVFRNPQTGFSVYKFSPDNMLEQVITIVGTIPEMSAGECLRIAGRWAKHGKFGMQFQVDEFQFMIPVTKKGLIRYLSSGLIKGVGLTTATWIVERFGMSTVDVLDNNIERLLEINGMGKRKLVLI
jgi:exodeoxyribonuclease V alpha subunit